MGNPLLDISAHVPDELVAKYKVNKGEAVLAEEAHMPVYDELVKDFEVDYVAGGATHNSVRVAKWMMQDGGEASYMGCIAADEFGKQLQANAEKDGVKAAFKMDESAGTGTCAVLVTPDSERTLIANLSAANNYTMDHFEAAEQQATAQAANVIYSAGFFLTVCPDAMVKAATIAKDTGAKYCMNLSAPFLMQVPPLYANMQKVLPLCDFIFGNETEAATFAEVNAFGTTDIKEIAAKIQAMPGKDGKIVVITQGADPTVIADGASVTEYPVIKCDNLVDTNGAGDAFVGGMLAGLAQGKSMAECVALGNYASNVIIQRSGCTFPDTAPTIGASEDVVAVADTPHPTSTTTVTTIKHVDGTTITVTTTA